MYFLPLSPQKFLVLILSTSEGWKAESTLEPPSGFEHGNPGLAIQCLNHSTNRINTSRVKTRLIKQSRKCEKLILWKLSAKITTAVNNFDNTIYHGCLSGFWTCLGFWFEYTRILSMQGLHRVLSMPKYDKICWLLSYFPIVIPCLIKCMVTYFNVYMKLAVIGIQGCFSKETQFVFFYSWDYLICLF